MRLALLLIVAVSAALPGCASRSGTLDAPRGTTVLPSTFTEDAYCLLHVRIRGIEYRMILDTGSTGCLVSERIAREMADAEIARDETIIDYTQGDARVETSRAIRLDEVALGSVRIVDLDAAVFDTSLLSTALGEPIDGIIGLKPFRARPLTIDYPRHRVSIGGAALREDAHTLVLRHPHLPMIDVLIGRTRSRAVLDTGSGLTVLRPSDAESRTTDTIETVRSATISGEQHSHLVELTVPLRIGPMRFDSVRALVDDTRYPRIGLEELRRLRVTFEQRSRLVRLARPSEDSR